MPQKIMQNLSPEERAEQVEIVLDYLGEPRDPIPYVNYEATHVNIAAAIRAAVEAEPARALTPEGCAAEVIRLVRQDEAGDSYAIQLVIPGHLSLLMAGPTTLSQALAYADRMLGPVVAARIHQAAEAERTRPEPSRVIELSYGAIPRDAVTMACAGGCGGVMEQVPPTLAETEQFSCGRDGCCERAFTCPRCHLRAVGRADAPEANHVRATP